MNISVGTITRTVILVFALVNQGLSLAGYSPIPIEDESITATFSMVFTVVTAVIAWWKNNSVTRAAQVADLTLKNAKAANNRRNGSKHL